MVCGQQSLFVVTLNIFISLLIDETHRPTAQDLLSNAWVLTVSNQNARMDRWIREVWS